jgi:hypothetical protein
VFTPSAFGNISHPENYRKVQSQSHISHLPKKYLYTTSLHKATGHSNVWDLKMLSMLDIYKKYSLPYNNLEVFCTGYDIRKGLAAQKQVPSTSILIYQEG